MPPALHTLTNDFWQVGILPETGASVAFGRIRLEEDFVDVMRPTAVDDYGNASLCASFIMLPWANRLRNARFRFQDHEYQLEPSSADGTAIHGVVRRLPWQVTKTYEPYIALSFDSEQHQKINYPFAFSAKAEYWLDGRDFVLNMTVKNESQHRIPIGFGHHPYFLTEPGGSENRVMLEIPFDQEYVLVNALPSAPPQLLSSENDYRRLRALGADAHDTLFGARQSNKHMRMVYPKWDVELTFFCDPVFEHALLFSPPDKPFFALEPQTNANDGFNLIDRGIASAGVIILSPGESAEGDCVLRLKHGKQADT
jgi:aldose 1-epimerase